MGAYSRKMARVSSVLVAARAVTIGGAALGVVVALASAKAYTSVGRPIGVALLLVSLGGGALLALWPWPNLAAAMLGCCGYAAAVGGSGHLGVALLLLGSAAACASSAIQAQRRSLSGSELRRWRDWAAASQRSPSQHL
jgi:hypothetical protein